MPTVNLHFKTVGNLPLPKSGRIRYWDETTPGLHVLATPTGRIYKARFQRSDGAKIDYRIGLVEGGADRKDEGEGAGPRTRKKTWSLSAARSQAEKIVRAAASANPGDDPQAKKLKARSKEETFGALAERCMKSLSLRPSTQKNWGGLVKNYLIPRFGNTDAAKIDRRMIRAFIERIGEEKPVQAARVFEVMRRVFSWSVQNDELLGTPFAGLRKPDKVLAADAIEGDRYLTYAEIHKVFETLKNERFTGMDCIEAETSASLPDFDHYIRLLFETAVRRDEMLKATWEEIDFGAKTFTIRTLRYKSKKPHEVPLTQVAMKTLKAIRNQTSARAALEALRLRIGNTAVGEERDKLQHREAEIEKRMKAVAASPYVFPGPKKPSSRPRTSVQRTFEDLRHRVGSAENWTIHDIRRTASRELSRLGTLPHVREAILGHSLDKLGRTYGGEATPLQRREALEKWSAKLDDIIKTAPSIHPFGSQEATGA